MRQFFEKDRSYVGVQCQQRTYDETAYVRRGVTQTGVVMISILQCTIQALCYWKRIYLFSAEYTVQCCSGCKNVLLSSKGVQTSKV